MTVLRTQSTYQCNHPWGEFIGLEFRIKVYSHDVGYKCSVKTTIQYCQTKNKILLIVETFLSGTCSL